MKKTGKQAFATAALAVMLSLGAACSASAQKVYTDYNHDTNFRQYHTFSIYRVHAGDQLTEGRLRNDISESLRERGWQEVPQGGDVAITAIGNVHVRQEYSTFYNDIGPGWGYGGWGGGFGWGGWGGRPWGWGAGGGSAMTRSYEIPIGTLAIDVYDTRTHQLVFRGTSSDELSKHADKNARKGAKAVDKIFDKLPVKHQG